MIRISRALMSLYPNAQFVIEDEDINKIRWTSNQPNPMPTYDELVAEALRLEDLDKKLDYQRLRKNEYPSIGDQLDALWKGGEVAEDMLAKIQEVKAKYPKPEGL